EVARKFFNNDKPIEAMMWGERVYHDTPFEDNSTILVRYENGRLGQAENSWTAHGGLDLRTEVYGTTGALFINNTRETGIRIFTKAGMGYSVEKSEADKGWIYPVPNEYLVYGYYDELKHFANCIIEGKEPIETFKDGVVVNAILDAAYKSLKTKRWEKIDL
ncbi:MAG: Gfo/Idh/MocA family oxidoreductase, partial [Promethearchaeota archaeon]